MKKLHVSVVITVFNEQSTLDKLINSLKNQSLSPYEVIMVDGGSTDKTFDILKSWSHKWSVLKSYQKPGNRSVGRNYGVSVSKSPIIAFTDAGCIPDADWLKNLSYPFRNSRSLVVSGYYLGLPQTIFEKCLIPYVLVMPDQAEKTEFFPSTRSMALSRDIWNKSGGFNDTLFHNEDYAYANKLKNLGVSFFFTPRAVVSWIPRKNLIQAAWMFMRFAIGDIQAGIIRPKVKILAIRYIVFLYLLFLVRDFPVLMLPLFIIILSYIVWSVIKNYRFVKDVRAFFWLPVLQITSDLSVLFGSIVGLLSRIYL